MRNWLHPSPVACRSLQVDDRQIMNEEKNKLVPIVATALRFRRFFRLDGEETLACFIRLFVSDEEFSRGCLPSHRFCNRRSALHLSCRTQLAQGQELLP